MVDVLHRRQLRTTIAAMPEHLPDYLTDEQRAIITAPYEHVVITAVAGSGKTSTLAWRIRYLLEQGHDPNRLLVLMFNRSARVDFERKLREVTQDTGLALPEIRTYHAMGLRLYRRFIQEGALPAFSEAILTDQEINFQVWRLTRELAPSELADEIRRNKKDYVETAVSFIDLVKTTLSPVDVVFEELGYTDKHRYLIELFHSFEQWRKRHSRISYADMLYEPVLAIHQTPALQKLVANKMDLILVDEYQDTNEIQHLLLRYVAGERARVTVVGDPDQTIYEFRGARPEFILSRFSQEFDSPLEQTLSYSFRYGHRVALLANHLIHHNRGRKDVLCHAHPSTPATTVSLHEHGNDSDVVLRLVTGQSAESLAQTAILFRVWSQSVAIELQLLARQVPYRIDAGKGALFSREVEAITGLLMVVAGPLAQLPDLDRLAIARQLLRFPHVGLKEAELDQLAQMLSQFGSDWGRRLLDLDFNALPPMAARKLKTLGETLVKLDGFQGQAAQLVRRYAEGTELYEGIRSLALTHETADERIDTIHGFLLYLAGLDVDAARALAHLQALRNQASQRDQQSGVLLSTIHRTKGLEWPQVIVPGLQEKYLPYSPRQTDDLRALVESERRLLYVAMTRCRQQLHLITRPLGHTPHLEGDQGPSRFVPELCFALSDQFGHWLDQRDQDAGNGSQLCLDIPITPISERYARDAGVSLSSKVTEATESHGGPLWAQPRLHHVIFGPGAVVNEDESAFEVRFDSGEQLNFSKKSAHLYFSLPQQGRSD
ncbi:ATP-dependent helicase [Marinobacter zhejiangensis]|uniref:DNA 3'-5' helicase n=1 Tax=Marinobacter zhejiangensis TaxID=488535 RepID=A0A1I4L8C2_9GAMM|nr:ATP-dependent helicase [Marinobacter zhejiangensis]SFL87119.1 DNA helicase-2 / ATP-dependent DNA helicase PcrA [Marinobacter zhejiangensis]